MPGDKEAVYTDLVDAVTAVVDQCFEETRVVEIGQDNWYPDLLFRQDTFFVYEAPSGRSESTGNGVHPPRLELAETVRACGASRRSGL